VLLVCLLTTTANAQPLFVTEHDWTVQIGSSRWGLLQTNMAPGDWRKTTVYFGVPLFTVRARAEVLLALVVGALGVLGVMPLVIRQRG
jgi:hypothetical protein